MAKKGLNKNLIIWGGVAIVAILFGPMILKTVTSGIQQISAGLTAKPAAGGTAKKAGGGMKAKRPKGVKSAKTVYDMENDGDVNRVTVS